VGFVVDVHELADGGVGIFLSGGERLVAEEFLNGAEVGAIGEKMRGERVAERVGVQVPIHVDEADVFLDDAAYGTLGEAAANVIEEDGFGVRGIAMAAAATGGVQEEFFAERPILVEGFLGFGAVGDDAFLVAFAADAEDTFFLVKVGVIEAGEFADAKAGGVEEFKESAIAAEEEGFVGEFGGRARRTI
jgi:hypothetical protein